MMHDHDHDAARDQVFDFLQDPLPIQLAHVLQPLLGRLRLTEPGEAAGQQGEGVGAITQEIEGVDRRLVLEQAAIDLLEPRLRAAAVASPREVVEIVAVSQHKENVAPAQGLLPRPGPDQLLIGTIAHDAQIDDGEVRNAVPNEDVEAIREIDAFAERERVAKDQKPGTAIVRPRRWPADARGVGHDVPGIAVRVPAHQIQVRQRSPTELEIGPEQPALLGDGGGVQPAPSLQSGQADR